MSITLPELLDVKNAGIIAEFIHWGNPYHGAIVGSTLTLPDATTLIVPATANNNCFDFHVPGALGALDENGATVPAPVPGGEWRDYLLMYGNGDAIYGKAVSAYPVNWLYAHPDGSRWLISITSATTGIALSNDALALTLRAIRFGEMVPVADVGAAAETIAFSVTLEHRGLDPAPAGVSEAMPDSVLIGISDIVEDGSKCCLMFYALKAGDERSDQRFPYAFFEVTLGAENFAASIVSPVYDIAAVAGTRQGGLFVQTDDQPPDALPCVMWNGWSTPTTSEIYVRDAIIACWYSGDVLKPIKAHSSEPLAGSAYVVSFRPRDACQEPYVVNHTRHAAKTMRFGHPDVAEYVLEASYLYTQTGTRLYSQDSTDAQSTLDINLAGNGASLYSFSMVEELSSPPIGENGEVALRFSEQTWVFIPPVLTIAQDQPLALRGDMHPWELKSAPALSAAPDGNYINAPHIFAKRFSSTLIGVGRTWIDGATLQRQTRIDKFITKAGLIDNSYSVPVDTTLAALSASLQPVSHEIAVAADSAARSFV